MKIDRTLFDSLSTIAEAEDRPLGYVARALAIRGLALYEKDGRLRDEQRDLAPVVATIGGKHEPTKAQVRRQFETSHAVPVLKKKAR